jgi:hypothetical protein
MAFFFAAYEYDGLLEAAIRCDDGGAVAQPGLSGHVFGEIDFDFSQRLPPPV